MGRNASINDGFSRVSKTMPISNGTKAPIKQRVRTLSLYELRILNALPTKEIKRVIPYETPFTRPMFMYSSLNPSHEKPIGITSLK